MFGNIKHHINKIVLLKLVVLISLGTLLFSKNRHDFTMPYVSGDGFEYIITTEALLNHGTADIRLSDLYSFKEKGTKMAGNWESFPKKYYVDNWFKQFTETTPTYKNHMGEFYCNKSGKWFSFHFFVYSLINLPVYAIMSKYDPVTPFYYTNTILILITCFFLLFFTPFSNFNSISAVFCFAFSAAYWYLNWVHTEVFTMCFVSIGFIFYFRKHYFLALFLISIACTQNQPLIILLTYLALNALIQLKFSFKNLIKIGLACLIAFSPPLFYYLNFESTNLIKDAGFLDAKYATFNRILGFYFDVNQGVILTIPFILLSYIILIFLELKNIITRKQPLNFLIFSPLILIIITVVFSTMGNWNHAMAVINRYATWMSIIIMMVTFYLTYQRSRVISMVLFSLYFLTQISTTLYHQQFNLYDWSGSTNRPLANWLYRNHPGLYSPDPMIFITRSQPNFNFDPANSPFMYAYDHKVKKILVNKYKIDGLTEYGFSAETIANIKKKIHYNYDWGYVDLGKYKSNFSDEKVYDILHQKKIQGATARISSSEPWAEQIKEKAKAWGKTYEEVLLMDAEYLVNEEEK